MAYAVIPFEYARLNTGDSFNLTSGIFTAPVSGIYHFEFCAQKDIDSPQLSIFLQVNGESVELVLTLVLDPQKLMTLHF